MDNETLWLTLLPTEVPLPDALRAPLFSSTFDRALQVAAVAHAKACRKGTRLPYISHPAHVARLLDRHGCSEALILAGLLHDVLEDLDRNDRGTRARFRDVFPELKDAPDDPDGFRASLETFIETQFGAETKGLVAAVTERKETEGKQRPWRERKDEQLEHLREAPQDVVLLKVADALHNASSVLADLRVHGKSVFSRFNAGAKETLWWYGSIGKIASDRLPLECRAIVLEFEDTVRTLHEEAAAAGCLKI